MSVRSLIQLSRQGLSPVSQIAAKLGYTGAPRFAGVALSSPDAVSAWGIAYAIAGGEYAFRGLAPAPGTRTVDIGANIGVFALWAARSGAIVTAYEPAPGTVRHLELNTRTREITPVHAAVVGQLPLDGVVPLYLHGERSTRNTLLGHEIGSGSNLVTHVEVPAIGINEVLADKCDLLKIDCEGGEFDIIQSVDDAALRRAQRIILEFHRTAGDPGLLLERLRGSGFEAEILAGADPSEPFGVIGAHRT